MAIRENSFTTKDVLFLTKLSWSLHVNCYLDI